MKKLYIYCQVTRKNNLDNKDNKDIRIEVAGWLGAFLVLGAYILLNFGVLKVNDPIYLLMNIVGSIGLLWISYVEKAYQPAFINIVWMIVALVGLVGAFLQ